MAWRSCAHQVKIRWRPRWLRTFPDPPTSHLCSPLGMSHNPTLPGSARIAWQWLGVLKENLDLFFQLVRSASAPASRRQKWNTVATDTRCLTPSHSPFAKATAGYVASCEVAFHGSMAAWQHGRHQTSNIRQGTAVPGWLTAEGRSEALVAAVQLRQQVAWESRPWCLRCAFCSPKAHVSEARLRDSSRGPQALNKQRVSGKGFRGQE
jgi:hypothetical protein